jgi:hypothetical protein
MADHLDCVALAVVVDIDPAVPVVVLAADKLVVALVAQVADNSVAGLAVLLVAGSFVVVPDPVNYRIQ